MNLTIDRTPPLSLKLRNIDGNNITLHHLPREGRTWPSRQETRAMNGL
jgi:hypothetical protein